MVTDTLKQIIHIILNLNKNDDNKTEDTIIMKQLQVVGEGK